MQIDFIGIGTARSNTTWIYNCLREHPQIFMPQKKELHFFDCDKQFNKGIDYYNNYFADYKDELLQGEFTPRYMLYKEALLRIKKIFPNTKIIISLRNPIERAWSQYNFFKYNKKKEPEDNFDRALNGFYKEDYLEKSLYYKQLKNVFEIFSRNNIHIILADEIKSNPKKIITDLYSFLGVEEDYTPSCIRKKINISKINFRAPNKLWAYINRTLVHNQRFVGGTNFGNKINIFEFCLRFNLRIVAKLIFYINSLLDRFPKKLKNIEELSFNKRKAIFEKYFQKDIENTEILLGIDLSPWKKFNK
jgi:hypothetical protein